MKIKCEIDLTPEELLKLFEGNTEALQKAFLTNVMQTMSAGFKPPETGGKDNDVAKFWQLMAEKSNTMFEQYKNMMSPDAQKKNK